MEEVKKKKNNGAGVGKLYLPFFLFVIQKCKLLFTRNLPATF